VGGEEQGLKPLLVVRLCVVAEATTHKHLWVVDLWSLEIHNVCGWGKVGAKQWFILGMAKIFRDFGVLAAKAKVGREVFVKREFSGFACSYEQAKNRRKPGETRLLA
jgi:hypothetical protein